MKIEKSCNNYFSFGELPFKQKTNSQKAITILKAISYCTLVIPIFVKTVEFTAHAGTYLKRKLRKDHSSHKTHKVVSVANSRFTAPPDQKNVSTPTPPVSPRPKPTSSLPLSPSDIPKIQPTEIPKIQTSDIPKIQPNPLPTPPVSPRPNSPPPIPTIDIPKIQPNPLPPTAVPATTPLPTDDATSNPVAKVHSSLRHILDISADRKVQDDYFMRYKRKLVENFLGTAHENRLSNQLIVLADQLYLELRNGQSGKLQSERLAAFLENPVLWTKNHGQGPAAFYDANDLNVNNQQYGTNYVEGQKTSWRTMAMARPFEPRTNDNVFLRLTAIANEVMDEVHKPVRNNLDMIDYDHVQDIGSKCEVVFEDFAFYNKDSDFITFEHVSKRNGYLGGVEFARTYAVETFKPEPWKICIFVANHDLPTAWNAVRGFLFEEGSPVQSGKVAKQANDVSQIVIYTFNDQLNPEKWKSFISGVETKLNEAGVHALTDEDRTKKFDHADKYQCIPGGSFCHYTLERYKIRPNDLDGVMMQQRAGNLSYNIAYDRASDFYYIKEADYNRLPTNLRVNPAQIPNPFEGILIEK